MIKRIIPEIEILRSILEAGSIDLETMAKIIGGVKTLDLRRWLFTKADPNLKSRAKIRAGIAMIRKWGGRV